MTMMIEPVHETDGQGNARAVNDLGEDILPLRDVPKNTAWWRLAAFGDDAGGILGWGELVGEDGNQDEKDQDRMPMTALRLRRKPAQPVRGVPAQKARPERTTRADSGCCRIGRDFSLIHECSPYTNLFSARAWSSSTYT